MEESDSQILRKEESNLKIMEESKDELLEKRPITKSLILNKV
jgi:hypothetical protein